MSGREIPCDEAAERMASSWQEELSDVERTELAAHLESCAACAAEAAELATLWQQVGALPVGEPSPRLRARFDAMLAAEMASERAGRSVLRPDFTAPRSPAARRRLSPISPWVGRFAAVAATLAIGVLAGAELASRRGDRQIEALRAEMASLHETVATALLAGESSSQRLAGVAYGRGVSGSDPRVAEALLRALENDPDVNVRLAALEALRPLAGQAPERPRLVAALSRQASPLVQLSLIEMLLESDGERGREELRLLLDDAQLDPALRGHLRGRLGGSI
jgi:anti-sigma factor RsiW